MSPVGLSPCPSCRSHRRAKGQCPHCGNGASRDRATSLIRLGLKVTAATAVATTMACLGPLDPTPVTVYGAPPPDHFPPMMPPPELADGPDSQIQDGWSYEEVQSQDEGPVPQQDGEAP